MEFPKVDNFPFLNRDQMIEVDRLMIEEYGITLSQMMENAGRALAILARDRFLQSDPVGKTALVLAGSGGNGGGVLVAARRLAAWGADVRVVLSRDAERMNGVPKHQLNILHRMGVKTSTADISTEKYDLIIDGLIGYSLNGAPKGISAKLITQANDQTAPILALDVPSGLDVTTGIAHEPTVRATATLTLALPKTGLVSTDATPIVGELYCADISVPPELYARETLGISRPILFAKSDIVRII